MTINPAIQPRCDALLIHVGQREGVHSKALKLAKLVVKRNLPGNWKVSPLGARSRDFEVARAGKRKTIAVGTAWNLVRKLKLDRDVLDAEPSFEMAGLEPDPDLFAMQLTTFERKPATKSSGGGKNKKCSAMHDWSLARAGIDRAHKLTPPSGGKRFGKGIKIGHPDTGYTQHPEIWKNPAGMQRLKSGYDYVDNDADSTDPLKKGNPGHGTKTASVIMSDLSAPSDAQVVSGAAPEVMLVSYRVTEKVVVWNFKNVAKAIYDATDSGCHVISMSIGGLVAGKALPRAVEYAVGRGVIVLAAAGNVWPAVVYPAKLDEVIAVAASNCEDKPWGDSASGKTVDLSAPGESVWTARTRKSRRYDVKRGNGTSFAVATTAGVCALWLAYHGREKLLHRYGKDGLVSVFKELLLTHGVRRPPGWKTSRYGMGILDAERLLKAKLPPTAGAKRMAVGPKGAIAPSGPVEELAEVFSGYGLAAVRQALAKELGIPEVKLDEMLKEFGPELAFHVATNMVFRQSIQNRLRGLVAKSKKRNLTLKSQSSSTLKEAMKLQ